MANVLGIDLKASGFKELVGDVNSLVSALEKLQAAGKNVDSNLGKSTQSTTTAVKQQTSAYKALTEKVNKQRLVVKDLATTLENFKGAPKFTVLANDVVDTTEAFNKAKNELVGLETNLKRVNEASTVNKRALDVAKGSYTEAQQRLTALGKEIRNTTDGFRKWSPELNKKVQEYNRLNASLKRFDATMGNHQRNVGNYRDVLSSLSPSLGAINSQLGIFVVAGLAVRDAAKTIGEFDTGLRNVEKTTGLSRGEVQKLGDEFINLSRDLQVVSANKLTQYATVAGQLGVKGTKDIIAFTETLAKLETATNISGEQGGAEIARMLQLVEGGVQNVRKFGDEIVALGNNFPATEKEILANAEAIAQNVGIYKIGRQDVLAFATATKSVGIEAELVGSTFNRTLAIFENAIRTGNGLETILSLLNTTQDKLSKRFKEDASGVFVDFIGALNKTYKEGGSVNEQLEKLGVNAVRDQRVIQSLAANGYDVLTRSLETARKASGSLDDEFKTQSGSLVNQVGRINVAWDNLVLSIEKGDGVIGKSTGALAGYFADVLGTITDLVGSNSWKSYFEGLKLLVNPADFVGGAIGRTIGDRITGRTRPVLSGAPMTADQFGIGISYNQWLDNVKVSTKEATQSQDELSKSIVKNKQYWEDQVSGIQSSINALDSSSKGTKEWIQLNDQLKTAQKELDLYSNKSLTGSNKSEINKQIREQTDLTKRLRDIEISGMSEYDARLARINDRYSELTKGITGATLAQAELNREGERMKVWIDLFSDLIKEMKASKAIITGGSAQPDITIEQKMTESASLYNARFFRNANAKGLTDKEDNKLENRLSKVVEGGVRSGIDSILGDITELGSNFQQVFTNVFQRLANSVTTIFNNVISTQIGSLLKDKIKDVELFGLSNKVSQAVISGLGVAGQAVSGITSKTSALGQGLGGALSGAALGTAIAPGIGTAVGAVFGAVSGIFGSSQAKKQQKLQEEQLAQQKKLVALQERQNALTYTSSIIGQMINGGIVTSIDRNEFGNLTTKVSGKDLEVILNRTKNGY